MSNDNPSGNDDDKSGPSDPPDGGTATGSNGMGPGAGTGGGIGNPVAGTGGAAPVDPPLPAGTGGAGSPPPVNCEYPAGPYAGEFRGSPEESYIGKALDPNITWTGYDEKGTAKTISPPDLQDCDGSQGRNLIVLKNTSPTCGVCTSVLRSWNVRFAAEQPSGTSWKNDWHGKGVFAAALITWDMDRNKDDASMKAMTDSYLAEYGGNGWAMFADSDIALNELEEREDRVIPISVCVDPRTMIIEGMTRGAWYPNSDRFPSMPDGCAEILSRNLP